MENLETLITAYLKNCETISWAAGTSNLQDCLRHWL